MKEELEIKRIIIESVFGILHTWENWITSFNLRKIDFLPIINSQGKLVDIITKNEFEYFNKDGAILIKGKFDKD